MAPKTPLFSPKSRRILCGEKGQLSAQTEPALYGGKITFGPNGTRSIWGENGQLSAQTEPALEEWENGQLSAQTEAALEEWRGVVSFRG